MAGPPAGLLHGIYSEGCVAAQVWRANLRGRVDIKFSCDGYVEGFENVLYWELLSEWITKSHFSKRLEPRVFSKTVIKGPPTGSIRRSSV